MVIHSEGSDMYFDIVAVHNGGLKVPKDKIYKCNYIESTILRLLDSTKYEGQFLNFVVANEILFSACIFCKLTNNLPFWRLN